MVGWFSQIRHLANSFSAITRSENMSTLLNTEEILEHAEEAEQYLKHLANKTRLIVTCSLLNGEMSVTELLEKIPITQPALSQHLALLRTAGLVATRRDGQTIFYRLADERVEKTMGLLHSFFCQADSKE